jgi:hypothetical protein
MFDKLDFSIIDFLQSKSAVGSGETWLGYVLKG